MINAHNKHCQELWHVSLSNTSIPTRSDISSNSNDEEEAAGKEKGKEKEEEKKGGVEGTKDREKEKVTPQVHVGLPLCSPCATDGYASPTVPMGELTTLFIHLSSDTAGFNHGFSSERRS